MAHQSAAEKQRLYRAKCDLESTEETRVLTQRKRKNEIKMMLFLQLLERYLKKRAAGLIKSCSFCCLGHLFVTFEWWSIIKNIKSIIHYATLSPHNFNWKRCYINFSAYKGWTRVSLKSLCNHICKMCLNKYCTINT